jgi:hypothetical protein
MFKSRKSTPWTTLVAACLGTTMMMLDVAVVNTAIPHIATDLHTGLGALKWRNWASVSRRAR